MAPRPDFLHWNDLHYKNVVDATIGGTFMNKTVYEAYDLLEDMAQNHYQWHGDRTSSKRTGSKYDVDTMILLNAKSDDL